MNKKLLYISLIFGELCNIDVHTYNSIKQSYNLTSLRPHFHKYIEQMEISGAGKNCQGQETEAICGGFSGASEGSTSAVHLETSRRHGRTLTLCR